MAESRATGFEVEIRQENNSIIRLSEKAVKEVEFKIDTIEEDVKDRSENVINKVIVRGDITPDTKDETRKLALWSMDKERVKVYRQMLITLRTGGETLRTYDMDCVFCIDYTETFHSEGSGNRFELIVGQRKDNLDGIQIGSV